MAITMTERSVGWKEEPQRVADQQGALFSATEWWREHWRGMPEFIQDDISPLKSIQVNFRREEDVTAFEALYGKIYHDKWMWFPGRDYGRWTTWRYSGERVTTRYPVYVISKGRWATSYTATSLDLLSVPYRVVVEPQEAEQYAAALGRETLLVLPFSNLGRGSIPARNYVWRHARAAGAARHWILDDNIRRFYRLNRNAKVQPTNGAIFRAAEDFVDRYENVALAGFQYESFAQRRAKWPPFALNTRIYSCILIKNDLPYRWRGIYNEDTDLSLRVLKDGWCTILFYAFLANKIATMHMAGGNTDALYRDDGRGRMARSLEAQHPDVVTVTWKWNRWQHSVNYEPFRRNRLRIRPGTEIPEGVNEYGMALSETREHTT